MSREGIISKTREFVEISFSLFAQPAWSNTKMQLPIPNSANPSSVASRSDNDLGWSASCSNRFLLAGSNLIPPDLSCSSATAHLPPYVQCAQEELLQSRQ